MFTNCSVSVVTINRYVLCAVLFEDSSENIMRESLKLFEEVVKNPLFKNTPIFVFLNKKDLFEDLIKVHSLKKCFPDYTGPDQDMNAALEFIQQKFRKIMDEAVPHKACPIQIIAARVRRDMKLAFGEVKESLKKTNPAKVHAGSNHHSAQQHHSVRSPSSA